METFVQIGIISLSLALDAMSVSVAGGVKSKKATLTDAGKVGFYFGGFQALMPILGWAVGKGIQGIIASFGHWIAFFLLCAIGVKMIKESFDTDEKKQVSMLGTKTLLFLAFATSIDAFVIGITLEYLNLPLLFSAIAIGIVTFLLSIGGFVFGKKLGSFFQGKVEIIGGIALIGIGIKIVSEHIH